MKNTPLILSVIALVAVAGLAAVTLFSGKKSGAQGAENSESAVVANGAIVYFNLDKVITDYDMANDLRSVVESKVQGIQEEVNRRGNKLQNDVNSFQEKMNKGLMLRSAAEVQAQKNQEIAEEQQVMMNNIGDAIKQFLDRYAVENGYAMVISTSGDILPSPVAAADSSLDVTEDIITKLNDEYVKSKSKNTGAQAKKEDKKN